MALEGREVAVVGRLRLDEWTSRDAEKRSRIRVVSDAVRFLDVPGDPTRRRPASPNPAISRRTGPPSAPTVARPS
jgi:single-stranded DNA-binding protein